MTSSRYASNSFRTWAFAAGIQDDWHHLSRIDQGLDVIYHVQRRRAASTSVVRDDTARAHRWPYGCDRILISTLRAFPTHLPALTCVADQGAIMGDAGLEDDMPAAAVQHLLHPDRVFRRLDEGLPC